VCLALPAFALAAVAAFYVAKRPQFATSAS